ncbi:MAG: proteasome accessory factor PafA2 family protein [Candidatus Sungiibacteriota bacterium]|uniref:Proteasome accessory factor PafA2 family protein n=1 Tax=Candidatus Sungiibacteriota bacterium TaxID=2750080 RepID=A0A7T5UQW6_9BACT|nr:MAG: proteasome accessory factor PafA2 family protein [Candidatus Sungbacteria bacterium]
MPESRATPKMCGIETELGVMHAGSPAAYSGGFAFVESIEPEWVLGAQGIFSWDPTERLRKVEVSTLNPHSFFQRQMWQKFLNILLPNGARLYVDIGPHTEISTAICSDPRMLVIWNRACYRWIDRLRKLHEAAGRNFRVFRNNTAGDDDWHRARSRKRGERVPRSSWACHENYTISRRVSEDDLIRKDVPWFVMRTIVIGAGKVGGDCLGAGSHRGSDIVDVDFQISQRADFFSAVANIETSYNRPIHNTRNVVYGEEKNFRRGHVIPGDSNMLELPEFMKAGLTAILYMMMEDGVLDHRFEIGHPVGAFHEISWDTSLKKRVWLINHKGSRLALDCLRDYCDLFGNYVEAYHPENQILKRVVAEFASVLDAFGRSDWRVSLHGKLDWVTKLNFIEAALVKKGKTWQDDLAMRLDCEYHDNNHESGIFYTKIYPNSYRITTDEEIKQAMDGPPPTRSKIVLEIIKGYPELVISSDFWHRITFRHEKKIYSLSLGDPTELWNEEFWTRSLSLPFVEFVDVVRVHPFVEVVRCEDMWSTRKTLGKGEDVKPYPDHGLRVETDEEREDTHKKWSKALYEKLVRHPPRPPEQPVYSGDFVPQQPFDEDDDWFGS